MFVAAEGPQETLLREEFPSLTFIELPGYRVKYDKNRALTILRLIRSIPKILIRIKHEKAWLSQFLATQELDLVISDNRYGLTSTGVFCVFMTHQLLIKTPWGGWADHALQTLNYHMVRTFSRCWIPDREAGGLAGELSHPKRMPHIPTRYIGWLSRFGEEVETDAAASPKRVAAGTNAPVDGPYIVALLSGPEPQRTLFEKKLLRQAMEDGAIPAKGRLIIVRGLPDGQPLPDEALLPEGGAPPVLPAGVTCYNHLPAKGLEPLLAGASLVIARSGYSTIMDLQRLGKQALLVPTPGQTEQEYLGAYLAGKAWGICVSQKAFSLATAFGLAGSVAQRADVQPQTQETSNLLQEKSNLLRAEISAVLSLIS